MRWMTWRSKSGRPHTEADYFARLAQGFKALVAGPASPSPSTSLAAASDDAALGIVVDCANGVGAAKLAQLASLIREVSEGRELLKLSLRNTEGLPGWGLADFDCHAIGCH